MQLKALAREAGGPAPINHAGPTWGYRHRARLSMRGRPGAPLLGIFQARSHRLVHIPDCPLHHPAIVKMAQQLLAVVARTGLPPYVEESHEGVLRTVQFVVEPRTEKVQTTLVVCQEPCPEPALPKNLQEVIAELGALPETQGLFINFQAARTNTLLGREFLHVAGAPALEDEAGGTRVYYPPGAFGQANPRAHERVVAAIHARVGAGPVIEYYAGVGTIGLGLVRSGRTVTMNELSGDSLSGLALGIGALPPEARGSVSVVAGPAGSHAGLVLEAPRDVTVIVDPPRKGLDPELLAALCQNPARALLYLSCGLDSLRQEVPVLLAAGYELAEIHAYPYFPFTAHVETLAVLRRR